MPDAKLIMLQGTASSVGKSLLAAGLCRVLLQDGYRVAPFKAQNMSNNSSVTPEGGEIGRAQAVQAQASGLEPHVDMNPVLLKPEADARTQVVVLGRVSETLSAKSYYARKAALAPVVLEALARLRAQYDVVVIEGAGSPAEINLRANDFVNMGLARAVDAPVLLVGDIDRGGVFAHLVGTLELLDPADQALVQGMIINKFRGDPSLLDPALEFLRERTGRPMLGVVPYLRDHGIPEEDSVALEQRRSESGQAKASSALLDVVVVQLPRIANFTDFEPLAAEPSVQLRYVQDPTHFGTPDLAIIPGTKSTMADLQFLQSSGLAGRLAEHARRGGLVLGICGGFQMLGKVIFDPQQVESGETAMAGLGLLPLETEFQPNKTTQRVRGSVVAPIGPLAPLTGTPVSGYEIHNGVSRVDSGVFPLVYVKERSGRSASYNDGAVSPQGNVMGTYIHGLFDAPEFRQGLLQTLAAAKGSAEIELARPQTLDEPFDRLAAVLREHLDIDQIFRIAGLR